jgi:hypothetical protein
VSANERASYAHDELTGISRALFAPGAMNEADKADKNAKITEAQAQRDSVAAQTDRAPHITNWAGRRTRRRVKKRRATRRAKKRTRRSRS